MSQPLRLCILISGNGSNLQSIIDAIENGKLTAQIVGVISNNPDAYGLTRAQTHGIPSVVINHQNYPQRAEFDLALRQAIENMTADLIILAGFMRILDSDFIQAFHRRILNIHPSLLPRHKGLNTHQKVLENGDSEHGVSIHLVTAELDDGPLLMQERYQVSEDDNLQTLQQKGHHLEHQMYPQVIQSIANGKLEINDNEILFNHSLLQNPLTLRDVVTA